MLLYAIVNQEHLFHPNPQLHAIQKRCTIGADDNKQTKYHKDLKYLKKKGECARC